ncbi:DUF2637 domain-containing protein [Streptacidiphilus cavernicola]|uniref:DUF2637 domain-containing protein n=1 Tax=Streptacidiphilus cavernicola TaxID=3342716 RepID=A0ABV6VTU5_9ACTN
MAGPAITRAHRALIGVVAAGAFIIAGIGFTGSYAAVRTLALHKGFGTFSYVFPIGVDVGIAVLLALDLVLTWLRIPFPLLRQTAWLLTGATVVFNAASSWGDALAMGMHAIIPVLFVVVVEAARHAIGRMADITADRHMESVRLMRWLLSPVPTFRLWRRMKLWELRSYDEVVRLEQNRLVYRTHLRARYGRGWRRQAPIETLLPLKLAKYGVPLDMGIIRDLPEPEPTPQLAAAPQQPVQQAQQQMMPQPAQQQPAQQQTMQQQTMQQPVPAQQPLHPGPQQAPPMQVVPQYAMPRQAAPQSPAPDPMAVTVLAKLASSRHRRPLHDPDTAAPAAEDGEQVPAAANGSVRGVAWIPKQHPGDGDPLGEEGPEAWFAPKTVPEPDPHPDWIPPAPPEPAVGQDPLDVYFDGLVAYREQYNHDPAPAQLAEYLFESGRLAAPAGDRPISTETLRRAWPQLEQRFLARYDEVTQ